MNELKNTMGKFLTDYIERDATVNFSDWLSERLREDNPEMSPDASVKLCGDIINAVAEYDSTLGELNEAVESGQSKEEWFSERLTKEAGDMPLGEFGDRLQQIEKGFQMSNTELMGEDMAVETEDAESEPIEWNKYSIKSKILEIGQQTLLNGMAATASAVQQNIEGGEAVGVGDVIKEALLNGENVDRNEVKSVVAGAIQSVAALGLDEALPEDVSVKLTGDIAGASVEIAGALADLATGKITMVESQDIIGRANITASCRMFGTILKGVASPISLIPVVGKQLSEVVGGLIDKASEKVASFVFDTAVSIREGLNKVGSKVKSGLKNFAKKIFG
jgi:hypothetical protein